MLFKDFYQNYVFSPFIYEENSDIIFKIDSMLKQIFFPKYSNFVCRYDIDDMVTFLNYEFNKHINELKFLYLLFVNSKNSKYDFLNMVQITSVNYGNDNQIYENHIHENVSNSRDSNEYISYKINELSDIVNSIIENNLIVLQ